MENSEIRNILEVLLFVSDKPLSKDKILRVLEKVDKKVIDQVLEELVNEYEQKKSPLQIVSIAGGYQMYTRPEYTGWVKRLYKSQTTVKLSRAALEVLSIIAYKQPVTRAGISQIRGVDGSHSLHTLLKKKLIKVAGKAQTLGRPALFCTTQEFLRYFGLESLSDMPRWEEIKVEESRVEEESNEEGS